MSEQTITATAVGAPDILKNIPLSRQVDVNIESTILEPVSHNYTSANGGRSTFNLPAKGVLDAPNASNRTMWWSYYLTGGKCRPVRLD